MVGENSEHPYSRPDPAPPAPLICRLLPYACLLGCPLLWAPVVYNAHARRGDGAVASAGDSDSAGRAAEGAQLETNASEAADRPFIEAAALAKTLWVHTRVAGCLESRCSQSQWDLVKLVWELELNHTARQILKHTQFASIRHKILAVFSEEARLRQHVLEEERNHMKMRKHDLQAMYRFDYDAARSKCVLEVEPQFNRTMAMVEKEFSGGCNGTCSTKNVVLDHFAQSACKETLEAAFCPEGTQCGCHFADKNKLLAAVVGAMAVVAYTGVFRMVGGNIVALTIPGKLEVGMLAAALSSKRAEGCRCLLSQCAWDHDKQACAPAPWEGARNPFQAVVPYVGTKCVAKAASWPWRHDEFQSWLGPGCEEAQPCTHEDSARIGQIGMGTYNCKPIDSAGSAPTLFPPLRERLALYRREFPHAVVHTGRS